MGKRNRTDCFDVRNFFLFDRSDADARRIAENGCNRNAGSLRRNKSDTDSRYVRYGDIYCITCHKNSGKAANLKGRNKKRGCRR